MEQKVDAPDGFISAGDAARRLSVRLDFIYRLASAGRLRSVSSDRRRWISLASVEAWRRYQEAREATRLAGMNEV